MGRKKRFTSSLTGNPRAEVNTTMDTQAAPEIAGAKATPRAGQRGTTAAERRPQTTGRPTVSRGSVTVPFVNVRVPVVRATVPGIDAAKQQTMSAAQSVRFNLPPLDRLLYYGGLGVAAVAGALEWPVAVAAGAGVWIATRARRQASRIAPG